MKSDELPQVMSLESVLGEAEDCNVENEEYLGLSN